MSDAKGQLPVLYLRPGELHIGDQPRIVTTVLGSCVSVTLYSARYKTGAICHGMMPRWKEQRNGRGPSTERFKYVDYAITYMMDVFRSLGIKPREVEVKLFGGANMFTANEERQHISVGRQNVMTALEVMNGQGLVVTKRDVGGIHGRKLHFYPHTGEVFLKRLRPHEDSAVIMLQTETG